MKFKNEIIQILVAAFLMSVLFMAFSWICIHYQNTDESLKHSISLTVSFMSVIATLFAALIAVLLFNDWRDTERFNIAKETLIALIKLKTHIDTNYNKSKYHLESYALKDQPQPPSFSYIAQRIEDAKNSKQEKEEYVCKLNSLLAEFFEKLDIYQAISGEVIMKEEDKDFNFKSFMYFITNMYTQAYKGKPEDILVTNRLSCSLKKRFDDEVDNDLFVKLKNNSLI